MKYALLIYDTNEAWKQLSDEEKESIFGEYFAVGVLPSVVGGAQRQPVETATTVRVRDGHTVMTDGPFPQTAEHLGGYYLVDADDRDAALELAARIPAARTGGAVEVRPLVDR